MRAFKVLTDLSDKPYLVIADCVFDVMDKLSAQQVYDSHVISIEVLQEFDASHIVY